MQVPVQISFEHIDHSEAIEGRLLEEVEKLEEFYGRITSARVVVTRPQHRRHKGDTYDVRIKLELPGAADVVVSHKPGDIHAHTDVYVAIRDAFNAARRQLQDIANIRQNQVKMHETVPHGRITTLRPEEDHGFIASADGREIYFHRNSVADGDFDALKIGMNIRFAEGRGDKGPQATYVKAIGKHKLE